MKHFLRKLYPVNNQIFLNIEQINLILIHLLLVEILIYFTLYEKSETFFLNTIFSPQ